VLPKTSDTPVSENELVLELWIKDSHLGREEWFLDSVLSLVVGLNFGKRIEVFSDGFPE
jgi:hypothetical protein